jgi:hypothetical protein
VDEAERIHQPHSIGREKYMDNDEIITPTRPLTDNEKMMRQRFYESIVAQSNLMDKLAERLLMLELAIPGLYATAVKLVSGDKATIVVNSWFYATFGCWIVALGLTLAALTPRKWTVNPTILKQDRSKFSEGLGIEDFFERSARYKRRLIIASSVFFFAGIISAVFTIL